MNYSAALHNPVVATVLGLIAIYLYVGSLPLILALFCRHYPDAPPQKIRQRRWQSAYFILCIVFYAANASFAAPWENMVAQLLFLVAGMMLIITTATPAPPWHRLFLIALACFGWLFVMLGCLYVNAGLMSSWEASQGWGGIHCQDEGYGWGSAGENKLEVYRRYALIDHYITGKDEDYEYRDTLTPENQKLVEICNAAVRARR